MGNGYRNKGMSNEPKFIVFNQPDLGPRESEAVLNVLKSGWIGTGKIAHQFEEEFAEFMGGGYAVSVSSCTMGLQLALKVLKIDISGDVITTPLTFAATLNAILSVGANPVLVDVMENGCIDMDEVNKSVTKYTKAILPVHYSGSTCKISEIKNKKIPIVEDCAHAFGSKFDKRGDFQVYSFYANKNITCGEGGMVLCRDKQLAEEIRVLSMQGLSLGAWERYGKGPIKKYSVEKVGYKGNMPDILAAIGLVQLKRWPEIKEKRMNVFSIYEKAFGFIQSGHSTHFYPLRVDDRDIVRAKLFEKGIGTGIHYKPLHLEPAYCTLGFNIGDFPIAEKFAEEEISLPVSSTMTIDDAHRVVEAVKEIV